MTLGELVQFSLVLSPLFIEPATVNPAEPSDGSGHLRPSKNCWEPFATKWRLAVITRCDQSEEVTRLLLLIARFTHLLQIRVARLQISRPI